MSLTTEANKLTTLWKSIIIDLLEKNNSIEHFYDNEVEKYQGILPIYPPCNKIFRCFSYFDPEKTRVVIIGQDPYHGPGQAMGLCFGVEEGTKIPPSLRNIMKKLKEEFNDSSTKSYIRQYGRYSSNRNPSSVNRS